MAIRSRASATYDIRTRDRSTPEVRKIKKEFGSLDDKLSRFGLGLAKTATVGAAGLAAVYAIQANLIDTLGKTSETLGIGVERWQAYVDAAERAGLKSETVGRVIEKMQVNIGKAAQGLSTQKKAFDELNLSFEKLVTLNPDERYAKITTALAGVEEQGRRAQIATDIFGGKGLTVLRLTADAIDESAKKMKDFGVVLTEIDVAGVEAANDAVQALGKTVGQNTKIFTAELAPAVQVATEELNLFLLALGGNNTRTLSESFANTLVFGAGAVGDTYRKLSEVVGGVYELAARGSLAVAEGISVIVGSTPENDKRLEVFRDQVQDIINKNEDLKNSQSPSERIAEGFEAAKNEAKEFAEEYKRTREETNKKIEAIKVGIDSAAAERAIQEQNEREVAAYEKKKSAVLKIAEAEARERASIVSSFESAEDSIRTETQIILDSYQDRQAAVSAYYKLEGSDKRAANDTQIALALELKDRLLTIEDEKNEALIQKDRERAERSRQIGADIGLASLDILKREVDGRIELNDQMSEAEREAAEKQNAINKKKFKQNQVYASAQALINTYLGISQVLGDSTLTFGQKIGAVAAVSLEGLAAIRTIKSAKFGSTSSTGSGGNLSSGSGGSGDSNSGRLTDQPSGAQPIFVVLRDDGMTDPRKFSANVAKAVVKLNQDHDLNIDLDTGEIESNLAVA